MVDSGNLTGASIGVFAASWAEATGVLHAGEAFLPGVARAGAAVAGLVYSPPGIGTTPAERMIALSIAGAQRTLLIANAYFVPTPLMLELLKAAEARGVDVRILLPGPRTDVPSTRWAGRGYYGELLDAGVRIWEYQRTMMHAKTLVIDGCWSLVGSPNFDPRSLLLNFEVGVVMYDESIARTLEEQFETDLGYCRHIRREEFEKRPLRSVFAENVCRLFSPVL